jgi:hypothetical protein
VTHPAFREGLVSTRFIEEHQDSLRKPEPEVVPAIAALLAAAGRPQRNLTTGERRVGVWDQIGPWGR